MSTPGTFGGSLQRLRKERGITQVGLTEMIAEQYPNLRVSQTTVSAIEQRKYPPKPPMLNALCTILEVDRLYFGAATLEPMQYTRSLAVAVLDIAYYQAVGEAEKMNEAVALAREIARDILD